MIGLWGPGGPLIAEHRGLLTSNTVWFGELIPFLLKTQQSSIVFVQLQGMGTVYHDQHTLHEIVSLPRHKSYELMGLGPDENTLEPLCPVW